jgi:DNA mismatch repair protein MutL
MKNNIEVLPEDLVDKIAAGEVVERPASVVKELVENSIDAGAKNITVEINNGGVKLIRVTDDGEGMDEDDSARAFQRHATSKIKALDDLFRISTLGFRGEALPSIASVSFLEMLTRTKDDLNGTKIRIEGGVFQEKKPVGTSFGTSVIVKELFFNVPARRKFLKTILTETRHIIDLLTKFSIIYPEIHFKLQSDGRELFEFPHAATIAQRISDVFGTDKASRMIQIKEGEEESVISGFLGKPETAAAHRAELYLFVNRRPITSKSIYHAVMSGYGELLPRGRYPLVILFIRIDPGLVDVNVHPTKSEVRFADERGIHDLVYSVIKGSLTSPLTIPEIEINAGSNHPLLRITSQTTEPVLRESVNLLKENHLAEPFSGKDVLLNRREVKKLDQKNLWAKSPGMIETKPWLNRSLSEDNLVLENMKGEVSRTSFWQLADTYILLRMKGHLLVLDQHAAHERILYEEALRNMTQKPASSQQILFPAISDLTPGEFFILEQHQELIQKLGFEIKPFGGRTVLVTAVPVSIKNSMGETFLKEILSQLELEEKVEKDKIRALAKSFACHAAIKAGERLNQEEMENLVRSVFNTDDPYTCPHGRPTIIKLTLDELNKKFGRS